jgi:hypothetical protein
MRFYFACLFFSCTLRFHLEKNDKIVSSLFSPRVPV